MMGGLMTSKEWVWGTGEANAVLSDHDNLLWVKDGSLAYDPLMMLHLPACLADDWRIILKIKEWWDE
jgi:hypothetical protein